VGGSRSQDFKTKAGSQSEISGGGGKGPFKPRKPSKVGGDYGYYLEPQKEV